MKKLPSNVIEQISLNLCPGTIFFVMLKKNCSGDSVWFYEHQLLYLVEHIEEIKLNIDGP